MFQGSTLIKDTAYFISAIRQTANLEEDPIVTDDEVRDKANEGVSALYDILIGAFQHYAVSTFDFTLAGVAGGNSVALPVDFYKEVGLDLNPTSSRPITIRPFTFEDRNGTERKYTLLGETLMVNPPTRAGGNYRLYYTPFAGEFAAPVTVTFTGQTTTPLTVLAFSDRVSGTPPAAVWSFTANLENAPFTYGLLGAALVTSGCDNADNNGQFTITDVPDFVQLTTTGTHTDESLGTSVTATYTVFDQIATVVAGNVWSLQGASLDQSYVGATLTITGTVSNNGIFTVAKVLSPTTFLVKETTTAEVFPQAVHAVFQLPGTFDLLPQMFLPWHEYITVKGALSLKEKIEQDTSDLSMRLAVISKRVEEMATNRVEEGGTIPRSSGMRGDGFFGGPGFWE